jgi:excisionase family DNA binding protein
VSTSTADLIALPRPQAASLVGLSDRELKRAIDDGELEAHWRGRKCLVDYADLQTWYKALPQHSPAA